MIIDTFKYILSTTDNNNDIEKLYILKKILINF